MYKCYKNNNIIFQCKTIRELSQYCATPHQELLQSFANDFMINCKDMVIVCFYDLITESESAMLYKLGCRYDSIVENVYNYIYENIKYYKYIDFDLMNETVFALMNDTIRKYNIDICKYNTFINKFVRLSYNNISRKKHNKNIYNLYKEEVVEISYSDVHNFNPSFEEILSKCNKLSDKQILVLTEYYKNDLEGGEIWKKYPNMFSSGEMVNNVKNRALAKLNRSIISIERI